MMACNPDNAKIINNWRNSKSIKMQHFKHITIATDKFKGGLSSSEAACAIKKGLQSAVQGRFSKNGKDKAYYNIVAIADGGDGSADIFKGATGAEEVFCRAAGPLGNRVKSSFMYCRSNKTAFIEMAKVSGLAMVPAEKRNPMHTTSYGLGEVIIKAAKLGAKHIIIGIGGSATNDGGTGMLQALGCKFVDASGSFCVGKRAGTEVFMTGGKLERINRIIWEAGRYSKKELLEKIKITVICDVVNPLTGHNGATYAFGVQKGANKKELAAMERGMKNFVQAAGYNDVQKITLAEKVANSPGAGAAGGLGFALAYFLKAEKMSGFDYFAEVQNLKSKIKKSDLIISGEGMIDAQSLNGKVVGGVIKLSGGKKKIWLFCGASKIKSGKNFKIFPMSDIEPDLKKRMGAERIFLRERACAAVLEESAGIE